GEDALIAGQDGLDAASLELALHDIPVLAGLSDADLALIARRLRRERYKPGDVVIRQGDRDRSVYIVAGGTTTVRVAAAGSERQGPRARSARRALFRGVGRLDRPPRPAPLLA